MTRAAARRVERQLALSNSQKRQVFRVSLPVVEMHTGYALDCHHGMISRQGLLLRVGGGSRVSGFRDLDKRCKYTASATGSQDSAGQGGSS